MLRDSIIWAERAEGHPLKRVEVSAFWSGLAKQYIREHPVAWLQLLGKKLGNFWSAFPYDDLGIISAFQEDGVLLPGPGFGLVAILALPGIVLAARRRPEARWIIAAVVLHMASLLTVFVTERYRLAVVPGLLLLAGFCAVELWRDLARRQWRAAAVYGGVLAVALLIVQRPVTEPGLLQVDEFNSALTDLEQGQIDLAQHQDHGRLLRAQRKLEHVLAATPGSAESNFALGNVYLAQGDRNRAKALYRRTLELDPEHERVLNNLGVLAMEEKRWPLAARFLQGSLKIDATDAKTQYLLAQALRETGDVEGARAAAHEALRLRPDRPEFQNLDRALSHPPPALSPAPLASRE